MLGPKIRPKIVTARDKTTTDYAATSLCPSNQQHRELLVYCCSNAEKLPAVKSEWL